MYAITSRLGVRLRPYKLQLARAANLPPNLHPPLLALALSHELSSAVTPIASSATTLAFSAAFEASPQGKESSRPLLVFLTII
jgi:hypothetical protein